MLDLATELELTSEQRKQTRTIYEAVKSQAAALGRQLVQKERELDAEFASGSIDADSLASLVSEIGELQAEIRRVHLAAHIEQKALLDHRQVELYDRLRGYSAARESGHEHAH